ncbi:molybdenum cofactor guanylyltransferase [Paenibacillus silvisoli]|uniref:molybdenum cofactor guanylyltransferase n=1 Tax=Paenibacillus silvisoli TaxID=3110539 RepID=UPI0028058F74|nr:molybdenum cofactor guanylyltransferase [Paenibacillus silvisoli]
MAAEGVDRLDGATVRAGAGEAAEKGLCGIILAGGQSRRMGTDKALLRIGETTLLRRLADQMAALGLSRIVLSVGDGGREAVYREQLAGLAANVVYVSDRYPDCGPLAGLHAALSALPEPGYGFVMACDMPLLSPSLFRRMAQTAATSREPDVIRTEGQPFHALYHTRIADTLAKRLEQRDLRVMGLLGDLDTILLDCEPEEEAAFVNLNNPELFDQYLRQLNR